MVSCVFRLFGRGEFPKHFLVSPGNFVFRAYEVLFLNHRYTIDTTDTHQSTNTLSIM